MPESHPPPPRLIDSHCHLQSAAFSEDLDRVLLRSREAGVRTLIVPGSEADDNPPAIALARANAEIFAVCGIHPHNASSLDGALLERLRGWLSEEKVVGVGETGLDFHYMHSPPEAQKNVFLAHIGLAREFDLPLVVHSREAREETLDILGAHAEGLRGVLHCFSGDPEMARAAVEMGFYISIAGPVTYRKAEMLREVVRQIPIEKLLIETDAPYLAPAPLRGKRNEPAYLVHTAAEVARVKGLSLADVARITSLNTIRLFRLPIEADRSRIAYPIRNSLYLNITNRCTNTCSFCVRDRDPFVKGHNLRLDHEPGVEEIISAIGDPSGYDEVVFCGYGEPLLRPEVVKAVASWIRRKGGRIRINTNGHADRIHGRSIPAELEGLVDVYSVSLNAADAETYNRLCRPTLPGAFESVKAFIREAALHGAKVVATVVECPGLDLEPCRRLAESLGATFRSRPYHELG